MLFPLLSSYQLALQVLETRQLVAMNSEDMDPGPAKSIE